MNFLIPFKRQVPGICFQSHSANLAAKGMCSKQFFNQSLLQSELSKNLSANHAFIWGISERITLTAEESFNPSHIPLKNFFINHLNSWRKCWTFTFTVHPKESANQSHLQPRNLTINHIYGWIIFQSILSRSINPIYRWRIFKPITLEDKESFNQSHLQLKMFSINHLNSGGRIF